MEHREITASDHEIFLLTASFGVLFLGWIFFVLALAGLFHKPLLATAVLAAVSLLGWAVFKRKLWQKISFEMKAASLTFLLLAALFSSFTVPTVFSGRDQGSFSEAAIRLAENSRLEFSTPASQEFFKIYGPGKALNFPGFHYQSDGRLITQFPLAYIAWLGAFYSIFGLAGFTAANGVLFFFFLLSFHLLARHLLGKRSALLATAFALTSFPLLWFLKYTLSENMALSLIWLSIFSLVLFLERRSDLAYRTFLFASMLLVFTRIEGIAILSMGIVLILADKRARAHLLAERKKTLLFPGLFFLVLFAFNFFKDIFFYKEIAKALLTPLRGPSAGMSASPAVSELYLGKIFLLYGLAGFILLALITIGILFVRQRYRLLAPFIVTLPAWTYLISSHISLDHPWMLRRYAFAVLPAAIFYSAAFFSLWSGKKSHPFRRMASALLALVLLAGSLPASIRYFAYAENEGMLEQAREIAGRFGERDLVLVDRLATGDGWSMMGAPMDFLFEKNAAYVFNPQDISKLDLEKFDNSFLLVSASEIGRYTGAPALSGRLTLQESAAIRTNRLEKPLEKSEAMFSFPAKEEVETEIAILKISTK